MLAGMNEDLLIILPQLAGNRGTLDELGPGADNRDNFHSAYSLKRSGTIQLSSQVLPVPYIPVHTRARPGPG